MNSATIERAPEVQTWLEKQGSARQDEAEQLAALVHGADKRIDEAIKWRRLTFTVGENWHHWLCAIAASKRGASLVFHKGALLDDPKGLLQGDNKYLREIPYEQAMAHQSAVATLVRDAIKHQTDMLDD
jgi:hypothetical protein